MRREPLEKEDTFPHLINITKRSCAGRSPTHIVDRGRPSKQHAANRTPTATATSTTNNDRNANGQQARQGGGDSLLKSVEKSGSSEAIMVVKSGHLQ